jgi:hypothetical protein
MLMCQNVIPPARLRDRLRPTAQRCQFTPATPSCSAAGWRAAVELKRHGIDVVVATQNLYGGTSACSGSDKQHCIRLRPSGMAMVSSQLPQPPALVVLMDFNRNPEAVPGDAPFSLDRLDADVEAYLENNGALLDLPIERLATMNPLSIELYCRYKKNIARDPLLLPRLGFL